MDVRQLTALVAVADAGSVTRAAELLHLVQPAVTRQIRSLEDELGVALFERTRRGMVPTDDGRVLLEHARRALRELDRARAEIRPARGGLRGQVAVGLLPSITEDLVERLVLRTRERHPDVRLRLLTGYAGHVAEWIDAGDVDVGLVFGVRPSAAVTVHDLVDEPLWAVGPPGDALDPARPVDVAELLRRPVVLPGPPHALRMMVDRAAARAGLTPVVVCETNSMPVQRRLAASGLGRTALPVGAFADDLAAGRVSAAPLLGDGLRRRLVLALPSSRRLGPAVHAVAGILHGAVAEAARSGAWALAEWVGTTGR